MLTPVAVGPLPEVWWLRFGREPNTIRDFHGNPLAPEIYAETARFETAGRD